VSFRASDWEFKNRAVIFGSVFGVSFPLYLLDPQNCTAVLANWVGNHWRLNPDSVARALFLCAAAVCGVGALIRTWASAYLHSRVVYAAKIQAAVLVAAGPYRFVRNPLYLGNVVMMIGMGSMMSRSGYVAAVVLMGAFCYRLIFREEAELQAAQPESYERYLHTVPRLWPSLLARAANSAKPPDWRGGLKAELWFWAFAMAVLAFALTFSLPAFFTVLVIGQVVFWARSRVTAG